LIRNLEEEYQRKIEELVVLKLGVQIGNMLGCIALGNIQYMY